eukprot:gene5081-10170_t
MKSSRDMMIPSTEVIPEIIEITISSDGQQLPLNSNSVSFTPTVASNSIYDGACDLATEGSIACSSISRPPSQSVWTTFGDLASKTSAVNLGQGFPDWDPPAFVIDALKSTTETTFHQYTRPSGHPALVETIARRYSAHLNRNIDPYNEVAITVGATQALYLALMTILKPGDEVLLMEPFFELYSKQIKLTGAITKYVSLGGNAATVEDPWALDIEAMKKVVTDKTRIIILNSPHNPTGKVFTLKEMEAIADLVRSHPNIIVISDEVYKYSIYDPKEIGDPTVQGHYHFARLPDMWDRTITLSSCGKTFSVTGWQVGWMVGPRRYIEPVQTMLPCVQFCTSTPVQQALTQVLSLADDPYKGYPSYYEWQRSQFLSKRKTLEDGLIAAGIEPLPSRGGFFVMGRLPSWPLSARHMALAEPYDWKLCRQMSENFGVVAIPASSFFSDANNGIHMARFAFYHACELLCVTLVCVTVVQTQRHLHQKSKNTLGFPATLCCHITPFSKAGPSFSAYVR